MPGIKHLIECHCVLAIYRTGEKEPQNHKFVVYSKTDDNQKIIPRLVKCNNCQTLHNVYDYCKSEIKVGKDQSEVLLTIDDLSLMLPPRLSNMLLKSDADRSNWEHILDIIEEKRWGESVVLKRDIIGEKEHLKVITVLGEEKFKIENTVIEDLIIGDK